MWTRIIIIIIITIRITVDEEGIDADEGRRAVEESAACTEH